MRRNQVELSGLKTGILTIAMLCFVGFSASITSAQDFMLQEGQEETLKLTGSFHLEENSKTGYLVLAADIPAGSYIYSLTQQGNPPPSRIEIAKSAAFAVNGTFKPDTSAVVLENDPVFNQRTEKHNQSLRFFIPLQLADATVAEELTIKMRFNGQICSEEGTCMPIEDMVVDAQFQGYFNRVAAQPNDGSGTLHR